MVEIKYASLLDTGFNSGLAKLAAWEECKSARTKLAIGYLIQEYRDKGKLADRELTTLVDRYCEKDAEGKRVIGERGQPNSFVIPDENEEAWDGAIDAVAMKLKCRPLQFKEVEKAPLTPVELVSLEPVLKDPPAIKKI